MRFFLALKKLSLPLIRKQWLIAHTILALFLSGCQSLQLKDDDDTLHISEEKSVLDTLDLAKPDTSKNEILNDFDSVLSEAEPDEEITEEGEEVATIDAFPGENDPSENSLSSDYIFCPSSIYMQSWSEEFDKQWLEKYSYRFPSPTKRLQELNSARLKAYIDLLHPAIQNYQYDFPVVIDGKVIQWIAYFQTKGRQHFLGWLRRSQLYIPQMSQELERHGLPKDLVYLAMIESGFNNKARSYAGAVGPWQFMPRTAKQYGLKMNTYIDERRDAVKSTKAAASYLTYLYTIFGSWHLAAASYNAGEGRILRAMKSHKEDSFFGLVAGKAIPLQTQDYLPKLTAAMLISKNPEKFGFNVKSYENPLTAKTILISRSISLASLAKELNMDKQVLDHLNPELRLGVTPPVHATNNQGYILKIPQSKYETALAVINKLPTASISNKFIIASAKRNESIKAFSKRNSFSLVSILKLNPHLSQSSMIKMGDQVTIPISYKTRMFVKPALNKQKSKIVSLNSLPKKTLHKFCKENCEPKSNSKNLSSRKPLALSTGVPG
ncbi:MAG: transglycosylase SLT domain-containing protein [Silvanigrellaceae bacterium]|nr:transglycosylase SLT domain-containing protein [Silvanigrellaceae bacterium]